MENYNEKLNVLFEKWKAKSIENGEEKVVNSEIKTIYDEEGNPKIFIKNSSIH